MAIVRRVRTQHFTPEQIAEHEFIRARFTDGGPSLEEAIASGDVEEESVASLGESFAAQSATSLLRRAREAAGLSLTDVAERSGIERSAISKLETGGNPNPTVSTLTRYAAALGLELHWSLVTPGAESPGS